MLFASILDRCMFAQLLKSPRKTWESHKILIIEIATET